ncbi:MAG TPA: hypothetical protein PKC91_04000 [Ignavibacteria bacterium]|nr:hypothetical protein [Ignavibacteria bacterium]
MKTIQLLIILYMLTVLNSSFVFSQSDNDTEENESGESILERQEFINVRRAGGPDKTLPKNAFENALKQRQKLVNDETNQDNITISASWKSVNPTGMFYQITNANYLSGRTNSMAFHPTDSATFYLAAAQGGVWKTTDNGANWTVLTDGIGSIASGDIAIDPNNPDILYYGTGEQNYSGDSQYGAGIFKSTNAGASWTNIVTAATVGSYISRIIVDPSNSNNVYCTTTSYNGGTYGFSRSTNAGANWTNTLLDDLSSLVMNPVNTQILYVSTGSFGSSKIYKSTNGGISWAQQTGFTPTTAGRIQLAISSLNPDFIYASCENSSTYGLLGLYRTTNAGTMWTLMASSPNYLSSQGWYDNTVVVVPGDTNKVIVGGLDIYSSTNGGTTLTKRTTWNTSTTSLFSHADIHYLGYRGNVLFCGSDGGVYRSNNNGVSWTDMNLKISTLQFQSADYDPTNIQKMYGGCQDNNKQVSTNGGILWNQNSTGDGGYTVVDPVTTNFIYGQYVNGSVHRSNNSGSSYTEIRPSASSGGLFYNPYEMAPGDHNTIVFARSNVWKTTAAQTASTSTGWTQIAATATVGSSRGASAIGISWSNTNKIYIGTDNGRILATTNNGTSWTVSTGFNYVSDLWVDSTDDNICYASFGGNSNTVRKTTNGGSTWSVISSNLPSIAVNSIVVKMSAPRTIFAGTDLGVYRSTNDGTSWTSFNSGFPNVEVYDLKYKESAKILMAATHGRGCFTFDFNNVTLNLTMFVQGFYDPVSNLTVRDTVRVYLRNQSSPYAIVDSAKGYLSTTGTVSLSFENAVSGVPYWIQLMHRNSIETWSSTAQTFATNSLSYSFSTAAVQAYGNNMVQIDSSPLRFAVYNGDENQNGSVDLVDITDTYNSASGFAAGYLNTDTDGNNIVDLNDITITYNNASAFVSKVIP